MYSLTMTRRFKLLGVLFLWALYGCHESSQSAVTAVDATVVAGDQGEATADTALDQGATLDDGSVDAQFSADAAPLTDASFEPVPCDSGTFDDDGDPLTVCVACAGACVAGTTETQPCSATTDRVCTMCESGTFDDDDDPLTACVACADACVAGTTETQVCSATTDRVCTRCESETFDDDDDPLTACVACADACADGLTELEACTPTTNRVCSTCAIGYELNGDGTCSVCSEGTVDHDGREDTPCETCAVCGSGEYEWRPCTPFQNRECAPCGSNPSGVLAPLVDRHDPVPSECSSADPDCLETVDVLVLFTAAYRELLDNSDDNVIASANQAIQTANEALRNSLVPPNYRFRLVAIEEFPYEERGDLKGDLVWLRNNPHYQATRRAHAADVGMALFGTAGFGGLAYSNHSTGTAFIERGLLAVDGQYFVPSYANCQNAMTTIGHELGHVLGAGHRASQYIGSSGSAYGYHNQEPLYRRNEAYGLTLNQHEQRFYSLMSYANYKNENNRNSACLDCQQLNVFSSPELWWFYSPVDPWYGTCLVIDDMSPDSLSLHCNSETPWLLQGEAYIPNPEAVVTLSSEALLNRAVPIGVDQPTYIDPSDGLTEVTANFSTRNRDRVMDYWGFRSGTESPLAPLAQCERDCGAVNRAGCSVTSSACGGCLPGFWSSGSECVGRIETSTVDPMHDGRFERGPISVGPSDGEFDIDIPLQNGATVQAIELYLMTVGADGGIDYDWAGFSSNVWSLDAAPEHTFEIVAHQVDGTSVLVGTQQTEGAIIRDVSAQKDHTLSYRFVVNPPLGNVERLTLQLSSSSAYSFNVSEVMVFGNVR